jgi:quinol monooxygenase YgiN
VLEGAVKPGKLVALSALIDDMVASTQTEPGSLSYEFFVGGDGGSVHVYERFADAAAALTHLSTFGERFAQRFLATVEPIRFTVMGNTSDQLTEALSGFGPTYLRPLGGFTR